MLPSSAHIRDSSRARKAVSTEAGAIRQRKGRLSGTKPSSQSRRTLSNGFGVAIDKPHRHRYQRLAPDDPANGARLKANKNRCIGRAAILKPSAMLGLFQGIMPLIGFAAALFMPFAELGGL